MQQIGYFNRPQASLIYILFIVFAFTLFLCNLWLFFSNKIGLTYLKYSSISNVIILIFAYPFLSSDIFNYIFDAKILVTYNLNPYTHKALDFPSDDWIRFMRWTHRYSPYGPLWLIYSLVPFTFGFGKFILTLFSFKIFIGVFHLINTYIIYQILKQLNPNKVHFGTAFYALNPLFLIEGVVNAHNDIILATFLLLSIYFIVNKSKLLSIITLVLGFFIKYVPILNLPWLVYFFSKKDNNYNRLLILNIMTLGIFTYIISTLRIEIPFISKGSTQVQFQPWYLFWTLPYLALIQKKELAIVAIILSVGALLRYIPFLYYGDWSHQGTTIFMQIITIVPAMLIALILLLKKMVKF